MKNPLFKFAVVGCAMASLALRAAAFDSVLIANSDVSIDSVSLETLKGIYTAKTAYWPDGQTIVIVVVSEKTDAALKVTWDGQARAEAQPDRRHERKKSPVRRTGHRRDYR